VDEDSCQRAKGIAQQCFFDTARAVFMGACPPYLSTRPDTYCQYLYKGRYETTWMLCATDADKFIISSSRHISHRAACELHTTRWKGRSRILYKWSRDQIISLYWRLFTVLWGELAIGCSSFAKHDPFQ